MIILWRLLLAHLLADFTLQTDWVNHSKRHGWPGMLVHTGTHLLAMLVLTWPFRHEFWVNWSFLQIQGWFCVVLLFLIHNLQDYWRIYTIKRFHTADGVLNFLWDQLVHIGFLFVFSPVVRFADSGTFFPEKWVILGCLFVLVTHAGTVMMYFLEQRLYGDKFPTFDRKYLVMANRALLWLVILLPGWQGLVYGILWLGYTAYLLRVHMLDLGRGTFYLGLAMTALCGVAGRLLLFY
ncbi:MAG TPA: DUF3307 domain-containing protein [Elusimicrobiales bacterium]|nr:DUF3307 domain-containing protein [Elusimicrobiales bacterium]